MSRFVLLAGAAVLLALPARSQEAPDKRELRYKFEKGEKIGLKLHQKMHVKIDEVPEAFEGILSEEPFDSTFDGEAAVEVKEVSEQGVATLAGKFQKIQAKGSWMGQDFEFSYDRAKDGEPKASDKDEGPGRLNPEELYRKLAGADLKLEIDSLGKIKAASGESAGTEQAALMFNLARLTGQFPKDKVGIGDSWKNSDLIGFPQLPIKVRVDSENTFEKTEKAGDVECALIRSKFSVGKEDEKKGEEEPSLPFNLKIKFTGEGKGSMRFAPDAGRLVDNEASLDLKVTVTLPDPEKDGATTIKGAFNVEQTLAVTK